MDHKNEIFGRLFQVANALQTYLDRQLKADELTAKQFFLMIVISSFKDEHPSFGEASKRFGSSYQNVKQMALKLQKHGFVILREDEKDRRVKRLALTEKAMGYFQDRDLKDDKTMLHLFGHISEKEELVMLKVLKQLMEDIKELEG